MRILLVPIVVGSCVLAGCAGESRRELAANLYDVTPEQCADIETSYMAALVSLEPEADELDRLTCQMNKCAARRHLETGGGRNGTANERTRFAYAPAALGGQPCQ